MFFLSDELSNKNYEHKLNVEYFNVEPSFKLLIICIFWIQLYISLSLAIFKFRMFYEMFRRVFQEFLWKKILFYSFTKDADQQALKMFLSRELKLRSANLSYEMNKSE